MPRLFVGIGVQGFRSVQRLPESSAIVAHLLERVGRQIAKAGVLKLGSCRRGIQ